VNRRLFRSRTDSVIGGVAGGVAEYLDVDPSIVRIVWAVLAIVTGGIFFVLYIVMWIVVPEGPLPGPAAFADAPPPEGGTGEAGAASSVQPDQPGEPAQAGGYPAYPHRQRRAGGSRVFGLLLVGLGVWFLVDEYVPGVDARLLWPVGLVLLGVLLLVVSMRRPSA
jgi:phage shock protein PspC (stress-responsive transcriptional regulator)